MKIHSAGTTISSEVRCKGCGTMLARLDETGLVILRGDLQATIDGTFRATLVCYQRRCRTLNIISLSTNERKIGGRMTM